MVFESIVADILNRVLGDYFTNFDPKNLSIGLWGGDVVLKDLFLKTSALDDLGLPFKVVVGTLGTLTAKIPWKSLYTSPVELNLQDLHLLVVPSYSVAYNEEAEKKVAYEAKMKELARLDEIRKKEIERKKGTAAANAEADTFAEKLTSQVIKNVQIRIESIHIRYEDAVTKPDSPFGFGVCLKSLNVETTDGKWNPMIITETVHTFHKLASLTGLSLYWNSNTTILSASQDQPTVILGKMKEMVLQDNLLTHVLGPISSKAKIKLTPSPEKGQHPFSMPKAIVDVVMNELALGLTNRQFQDITQLADSMDSMSRAQQYRKFRPLHVVAHKGHYKEWWRFAFDCIMEEEIRRRKTNWEWEHMKQHRKLVKIYFEAYYTKLTTPASKKMNPEVEAQLHMCEKLLDTFNIALVRKQVEVKVDRLPPPVEEPTGWFSSWFGGGTKQTNQSGEGLEAIRGRFMEALTQEEKDKLYHAIDYEKDTGPVDYPKEYEEYNLNFNLLKLCCTVRDEDSKVKITEMAIANVGTRVATRPNNNCLKLEMTMENMEMLGSSTSSTEIPKLITTIKTGNSGHLLEVLFETHPLNAPHLEQRIIVSAQPLEIVYHSDTIIELVKCFTLPPDIQLAKLQAQAYASFNEWKEQSTAGIQHMLESRGEIELIVDVYAPYVLVPSDGLLKPNENQSVLILDLGEIHVKTKPRDKTESNKHSELTADQRLQQALEKSYDSFVITLKDFQVLFTLPGEDLKAVLAKEVASKTKTMAVHLIKSEELEIQLDQCIIRDDVRLPKMKIRASLPLLDIDISEQRLIELVQLVVKLPLPQSDAALNDPTAMTFGGTTYTLANDPTLAQANAITHITFTDVKKQVDPQDAVQYTNMVVHFNVDSIKLKVNRGIGLSKTLSTPLIQFELSHIRTKYTDKTFGSGIDVDVGGLTLASLNHKMPDLVGPLYLLKTPMTEGADTYLLNVHMFSITPDCPEKFMTDVKQLIKANISSLDIVLHLEAMKSILSLVEDTAESFNKALESVPKADVETVSNVSKRDDDTKSRKQVSRLEAQRKLMAKKHVNKKDILLQLDAHLDSLTLQMSTESKNIVKLILAKLDVSFTQKPHKQLISMDLTELKILNLDQSSFYKNILTVEDDKVMHVYVTMYNEATKGKDYLEMSKHDMKVKVKTGCAKIVYLSNFVNEIMEFVDKFQAAKDAVVDASSAAAGAAMENAEQLYASSSRIALDIELLAPKVIVPRNGESSSGILADFGHLSIKNAFKTIHAKESASPVIVDEMKVQLSKMKMSRIIMEPSKQEIIVEILMLDPLTATVSVQRNLSAEWYNEIPNIEVVGKLDHVFLRASNEDYDILMACLNENVAAPSPQQAVPEKSVRQRRPSSVQRLNSSRGSRKSSESSVNELGPKKSTTSSAAESKAAKKDYCTIKIDIIISKTGFVMYEGQLKAEGNSGLVQRKQAEAFADFAIVGISLGLTMWTNNNMNCDIVVQDMNLEDCRPGKREIKHLIQRKLRSGTTIENSAITKVTVRTDAAGKKGTTTNIETTSLTLVLCLDYLMKIAGFFSTTSGNDKKPQIEIQKPEAAAVVPAAQSPGPSAGSTSDAKIRVIDTIPEEEAEHAVVVEEEILPSNTYITMGETEIILVETMETIDTNALLLNCEVSMKMSALGTKSNMMGAVNRVTLFTCSYNPASRARTLAEVISPMSITFVMNVSDDNGTLIDVNISDIFIRLTAGTLELLIKISSSITAAENASTENAQDVKDYSDLWKVRKNAECDYWFLNQDAAVEVAEEALNVTEERAVKLFEVAEDLVVRERLVLESGCIVLTFETGFGSNTTPILLIETDIDMQVFDWSEKLQFAGRLKLEAAYYNAVYGMWEFLIEPVETRHHGKVAHQPWELLFEYTTVDCVPTTPTEGPAPTKNPTFMAISLLSHDILELTITKTALEVINMLTKDFSEAAKALVSQRDIVTSPYTIVNECGSDIELDLSDSSFVLVRKGLNYDKAHLKTGTSLSLALAQSYDMTKHHTSILKEQEGKEERLLKVKIPEFDFFEEIPVHRAEKRYYDLKKKTDWGSSYGLIFDVSVKECTKIVTIRGVVQVENELTSPVDVYYMDNSGNNLVLLGTAEKEKPLSVPLVGIYTKSCELFFAPQGYSVSTTPYIWTSLLEKLHGISYMSSRPRNPPSGQASDFHMKVIGQVKQALWKGTNRKTIASQYCTITLKPPLILDNLLPVPLGYFIAGTSELVVPAKGNCVQITDIEVHKKEFEIKLKIPNYDNESWSATVKINKTTHELSTRVFLCDRTGQPMSLGVHKEIADEIMILHIYCPFWMINRTALDLLYKGEDKESPVTKHPANREEPVLFSFREKAFFSKKKAMVSVDGRSDWSEKFSLDVAGSCGSVTCNSPNTNYQVGIEIVLTSWGLTKMIIFSPRFYIINHCATNILLTEKGIKEEIKVEPKACVAFWPRCKVAQAIVCFEDEPKVRSKPLSYEQVHNTLLELPNKYGGIHVDVHMTELATLITFSNFIPGQAPVLLINATPDSPIEISEKDVEKTRMLMPNTSQLITWMDPMGKRTFTWSPETKGKKNTYTDKLHGDGTGTYKFTNAANVEKEYYWVCFLDNLQRVLLFTTDVLLCAYLQSVRDIELPTGDYTIMLHGIGISLVDNEKCKELMYMRIASSEIAWETSKPGKKQRFKPLPLKDSQVIETAYQNYLNSKAIASAEPVKSHLNLDIGMEVDFLDLKVLKPKSLDLRRVFQTGLWLHYKQFPHSSQFHAKLNRIQIDNQMDDCIFRIVLAPIPPPKSVSSGNDLPKPFAEVSIMQRMTAHSSVIQYKYFKVLVQEFHIRLDINFVNALVDLFTNQSDKKVEHMVDFFNKDYDEACTSVVDCLARHNTSQGQKHFYDFLHFSPLKIHVSFSMGGATQLSNNFLNLLLQSVGVTLTEIQDVVFKLACLELQHMFLSGEQLQAEAYSHYSSQAIKQLYVLVLGLDVIGNPYGLVMGVTEGVEAFFYEPFQGAIQGPGEFAEGLALGVKSLVGSTVGGAAGALGKITGTLGKGLAALTMDEDYQRKRRENLSKRNDVAEGMAQSGKGLVMGFVDGVTGVFTKPFKGAKNDGVEGFFKGLGKGAIGLVARPTAGVVDFTSGTFDAVKKATSTSVEVRRMRPPRHIPKDTVLQPYVCHEAEGMQLLHELEKGKYIPTDTYIAHALVNPHGILVLLLTNKRVMYLKKEEFFGGWTTVWTHVWDELSGPPNVVEKGLRFYLKERKKKKMGGLSSSHKSKERFVPLYSADVCTWILSKIESAMKTEVVDSAQPTTTTTAEAAGNSSSANNSRH